MELKDLLNPDQFTAATTTEGPLLVLAGAGSGKTRVLVHRIAYILQNRLCRPWEIMAVTFTNKAAGEMRDRLEELIGPSIQDAWIGTFHSMCGRILRRNAEVLGYTRNFSIYDSDDSRRVIKRVMRALNLDTHGSGVALSAIAGEIDRAKNRGETAKQYVNNGQFRASPAARIAERVYPKYQTELQKSNAMDFGDMLLIALQLLKHHPDIRRKYGHQFHYVMVDEFQDTNSVQYDLLKLLVQDHDNLMVVGDDDQSIYRWRGADVKNILNFPKKFRDCTVVKLEQNYRSSSNILCTANAVIAKNRDRHPKTLRTDADDGVEIGVALLSHSDDEALVIAQGIATRIREGQSPDDFAILYRQNAQSRLFELAFRRARVPFVLIGSTAFFERKEVKDILAYLRLITNPDSSEDFERIINVPSRKIGAKTVEKLRQAASKAGVSGGRVLDLPEDALKAEGIKGNTLRILLAVGSMFRELRLLCEDSPATQVVETLIERIGYLDHLQNHDPATAEDRSANIAELVTSIADFESLFLGEEDSDDPNFVERTPMAAFLEEAALASASDKRSEQGSVSMLTLHAAKGLEFPVVFMVGMEENTFPSRRAVEGEPDDIEEERRLCYVGITRAQHELNFTAVRYRRIYGTEELRRPSRFLGDVPQEFVRNMPMATGRGNSAAQTSFRGSDLIEFDIGADEDDEWPIDPPHEDFGFSVKAPKSISTARIKERPEEGNTGRNSMKRGTRVSHRTFGEGTVERVDGLGAKAHLTILFPDAGRKRVVARYVEPMGEPLGFETGLKS